MRTTGRLRSADREGAEADVIVVRGEGPRGGPGMREMLALSSMIKGIPHLSAAVALITEGASAGTPAASPSATSRRRRPRAG